MTMEKEEIIEQIRKLLLEYNEQKSLGDQDGAVETLKKMQMLQDALSNLS